MEQYNILLTQCRHIEHMLESVWFKNILTKRQLGELEYIEFACAMIVHIQADQLMHIKADQLLTQF